jgi:cytochrome c biogenesis protein CcmG/thiol:disulfide interchange protein DsbE
VRGPGRRAGPVALATAFVGAVGVGAWLAVSLLSGPSGTSAAQARAALRAGSMGGGPPPPGGPSVGWRPPALTLAPLSPGRPPISLAALRGKPMVVDFFASWCQLCRVEMPLFAQEWRRLGSRVAFVGVDVNDSRAHALALLQADHVGYPVGSDPEDAAAQRFRLVGLPTAVFIGADGRVVYSRTGQLSASALAAWVGRLAAEVP